MFTSKVFFYSRVILLINHKFYSDIVFVAITLAAGISESGVQIDKLLNYLTCVGVRDEYLTRLIALPIIVTWPSLLLWTNTVASVVTTDDIFPASLITVAVAVTLVFGCDAVKWFLEVSKHWALGINLCDIKRDIFSHNLVYAYLYISSFDIF